MLNMYRFFFKNHRKIVDGEEYVVAVSPVEALEELNKVLEKANVFIQKGEVLVEQVEKNKSLCFTFGEAIEVSRYLEEHPKQHYVGSIR